MVFPKFIFVMALMSDVPVIKYSAQAAMSNREIKKPHLCLSSKLIYIASNQVLVSSNPKLTYFVQL